MVCWSRRLLVCIVQNRCAKPSSLHLPCWSDFIVWHLYFVGTLHVTITILYYFLYFCSISSFYGMILVIARGWYILNVDLKYDRLLIPGAALVMGVCLSLASLFSGYFLVRFPFNPNSNSSKTLTSRNSFSWWPFYCIF